MAHFAEIGLNNTVLRVITVHNNELLDENGQESETKGREFCRKLLGGTWVQTSYNGSIRKNYAGENYTYNPELDIFIPPKPFDSWTLNNSTYTWESPVPYPQTGNTCAWDETSLSWKDIPLSIDIENISIGTGA